MEASTVRPATRLRAIIPESRRQSLRQEAWRNTAGPVKAVLYETGELAAFIGRALVELRGVPRYAAEVLRQAGILIVGTAAILWFMEFVMGTTCATEADYVLRGYGAVAYTGVFTEFCGLREMAPYMFGYIFAAKVGCGLVAEIGSMRINDEIDAMESMGMDPMRYIVGTRLVATWMTVTFMWIVGLGMLYLGEHFVLLVQIHEVSRGGFELIHWSFANPLDIIYAEIKANCFATLIVLVGMYYGYTTTGGPSGVGRATARSMIVNLVALHVLSCFLSLMFWGVNPNTPVGG
jgi:phospholipid/cholesterol/gamma-HCH transport system permease protein